MEGGLVGDRLVDNKSFDVLYQRSGEEIRNAGAEADGDVGGSGAVACGTDELCGGFLR